MKKQIILFTRYMASASLMLLAMSCEKDPEGWKTDPIPDPGPDITISNSLSFTSAAFLELYPPSQVAFYPTTAKLIHGRTNYSKSPYGTYWMGNGTDSETNFPVGEKPLHLVALGGFKVSRNEVTVAQYRKFVAANAGKVSMPPEPFWGWDGEITLPDGTTADRSQFPIVNVTWKEAKAYAEWVGGRLPTEAEFEFIQRNYHDDTKNHGAGNTIDDVAWTYTNSWRYVKTVQVAGKEVNRYGRTPGPIDSRKSTKMEQNRYTTIGSWVKNPDHFDSRTLAYTGMNPLPDLENPPLNIKDPETGEDAQFDLSDGVCDIAGNVMEWCGDWYSTTYYQQCYDGKTDDEYWTAIPNSNGDFGVTPWTDGDIGMNGHIVYNPKGPNEGERKVIRGGGYMSNAAQCRSNVRSSAYPGLRDLQIGFRVVWDRPAPGTGPESDVDDINPLLEVD